MFVFKFIMTAFAICFTPRPAHWNTDMQSDTDFLQHQRNAGWCMAYSVFIAMHMHEFPVSTQSSVAPALPYTGVKSLSLYDNRRELAVYKPPAGELIEWPPPPPIDFFVCWVDLRSYYQVANISSPDSEPLNVTWSARTYTYLNSQVLKWSAATFERWTATCESLKSFANDLSEAYLRQLEDIEQDATLGKLFDFLLYFGTACVLWAEFHRLRVNRWNARNVRAWWNAKVVAPVTEWIVELVWTWFLIIDMSYFPILDYVGPTRETADGTGAPAARREVPEQPQAPRQPHPRPWIRRFDDPEQERERQMRENARMRGRRA